MRMCNDSTSLQRSWPLWRWLMTGLNVIALLLSIIMSWHYLKGGSMIGCGTGSPCEQVLVSKWSTIAGILPVSGLAVGVYLTMLVCGYFIHSDTEAPIRSIAWSVMLLLAGSVAGSVIWFTILQKWIIGHFCPYCMTSHVAGFLLSFVVIRRALIYSGTIGSIIQASKVPRLTIIGMVLAGIMALCQIAFTPPAVKGESQNAVPVIDNNDAPIIGSPDAPYKVTLLFDYQCSYCQKLHFMLSESVRRYNGKLAFILCPTPLSKECNPYIPQDVEAFKNSCELAKVSLAVWFADKNLFPGFDNWMFMFESGDTWRPRTLETAIAKAAELVGKAKFDAALSDPRIDRYMQTGIQIFGQTIQGGKAGIPKLVFGSRWVVPEPDNADELVLILQKSLELPSP